MPLRAAQAYGVPAIARNDSKGCGGVMRSSLRRLATRRRSLTANPAGSLSAGHLAVTIAALRRAEPLPRALDAADLELRRHRDHEVVVRAVDGAREVAVLGPPGPELIERLGGGWGAEEALAIAICCALAASDFRDGVLRAVNHSGHSDSTGAIAGNLLGAMLGVQAIPKGWLSALDLRLPAPAALRPLPSPRRLHA